MSVYLIIEVSVTDSRSYSEYVERVRDVVEGHGGTYLVRGGRVTPLSGGWAPERVILIEFESAERLKACFGSPEYRALAPLREGSTRSRAVVVEGCGGA